jgi:hypothetical protein
MRRKHSIEWGDRERGRKQVEGGREGGKAVVNIDMRE